MSSGLTAAGLLVLLLALIGLAVGLYYAYICLQARPLTPKHQPPDSERGPLIPPDLNGNHEDVALEASAPEDDTKDEKLLNKDPEGAAEPDVTDNKPSAPQDEPSTPPGAPSAPQPSPKENNDVLIPVEDDVPPASVVVENETPVKNVVVVPHSPPKQVKESPSQARPEPRVSPVYIPAALSKKPVALSDEEDGLLLHECLPNEDDSLEADEHTPEPQTDPAPMSAPPQQPLVAPVPISAPPQGTSKPAPPKEPVSNDPSQPESKPEAINEPKTPPTAPVCEPEVTTSPTPQVFVAPTHPSPNYGWKEDLKPVAKAPEPVPSEVRDTPTAQPVKEEEEQLHPIIDRSLLQPISSSEQPTNDAVPEEAKNETAETFPVDGGDPAKSKPDVKPLNDAEEKIRETPKESGEPHSETEKPLEPVPQDVVEHQKNEESSPKEPLIVVQPSLSQPTEKPLEEDPLDELDEPVTSKPLMEEPKRVTPLEDTRSVSSASLSSEEALPPYVETIAPQAEVPGPTPTEEPEKNQSDVASKDIKEVPVEKDSHNSILEEEPKLVPGSETVAPTVTTPPTKLTEELIEESESDVSDDDLPDEYDEIPSSSITSDNTPNSAPVIIISHVENENEPCEALHNEPKEAELPEKATESSLNKTSEAPLETCVPASSPGDDKATETQPDESSKAPPSSAVSHPVSDFPLEISSVPLDAYIIDSDDHSDDEGSSLPVITEETGSHSESESETESSEPEVTEYSFSSGPSCPGTSMVLAGEVSCAMEPKMTKISAISDSEESKSSDDNKSEGDRVEASPPSTADTSNTENDNTGTPKANGTPGDIDTASKATKDTPGTQEDPKIQEQHPTNIEGELSDSECSEEESDGVQAELEMGEEVIKAPTAIHDNKTEPTNVDKEENSPQKSKPAHIPNPTAIHDNKTEPINVDTHPQTAVENGPQNPKPANIPNSHSSPQETMPNIPNSEDEGESDYESESESSPSDLSDCEVTTSTPKKSKIPRLVTQSHS